MAIPSGFMHQSLNNAYNEPIDRPGCSFVSDGTLAGIDYSDLLPANGLTRGNQSGILNGTGEKQEGE